MLATWGCTTFPKPTLSLDFLGATSLDSGITFSRGSQATLFDSTGTLRYAKHNLLTQSEDAVTWTPAQLSVSSNSILAPNGTLTADTLTEDTTTNFHRIQPATVTFVSGFQYTFSVFLKNGDRNFAQLFFPLQFSTADYANFDISTGALGTVGGSATASIVSVGSGWYRCSVTATATSSGTGAVSIGLITSATAGRAESYLGASKFIYVWGIQLNIANMEGGVTSSLTTYYPTTTAAYYAPRFDYNPSTLQPRGLLIEEQRTNSLTYSDDFANAAWAKDECSVTANAIVAPDGTLTGDIVIANTAALQHQVRQTITLAASTTYTISVYAKAGGENLIGIGVGGNVKPITTNFDLSTLTFSGDVSVGGTIVSKSFTPISNGWNRISLVFTTDSSGTVPNLARISPRGFALTPGDGTSGVYIWGAQLEAGAFATSYIPTTTTALTRNADVASMTGTNFSSWYNASEGTFVTQFTNRNPLINAVPVTANDNTNNNRIGFDVTSTGFGRLVVDTAGASQVLVGTAGLVAGGSAKMAGAYKVNDFAISKDGGAVSTDTNGTVPTVTQLQIGSRVSALFLNSYIQRIAYYPTRLPDATLVALTA